MRALNFDPYGRARPAGMAVRTAVPCILLIRMRPLVQVQPGPQTAPDQRERSSAVSFRGDRSRESPARSGLRTHPSDIAGDGGPGSGLTALPIGLAEGCRAPLEIGTNGDTNVHTTVNRRGRSRLSRRPRPGIANIVSAVVTSILRIGSFVRWKDMAGTADTCPAAWSPAPASSPCRSTAATRRSSRRTSHSSSLASARLAAGPARPATVAAGAGDGGQTAGRPPQLSSGPARTGRPC